MIKTKSEEKKDIELFGEQNQIRESGDLILSALGRLLKSENDKKEYSDEERLKAAYALNLCTVSVSQIVDYNDVQILEQEYEMILNNLNLENIPKDEALLNILKQLLDTITFFRIQEGDKKIVDKEYQQKMKNAIWSAVPNFGLIVAGGNPITMGISLASQIGIGYMNYRKTKAENGMDYERQKWQLQRAAIEQLNGLRRELFDTAWRLADEYRFPDEYRLTEKQIQQYNKILMDKDPIRRYERLTTIADKFVAYVPFWYYYGNTANQIAQNCSFSMKLRSKYKGLAKDHFAYYLKLNDKKLLREDQITSACALEYIDLLDSEENLEKINHLLETAVESSGGACDILQLCAVAYLKIKNIDSASSILRQLINEDYNVVMNSQILSNIYVSNYVYKINPDDAYASYELLETRVKRDYLFPMPENGIYDIEQMNKSFSAKQKKILSEKYRFVLNEFIKKYTILFNKILPLPNENILNDSYFLDGENSRTKRIEDFEIIFNSPRKKQQYCYELRNEEIIEKLFNLINRLYNSAVSIKGIEDQDFLEIMLTGGIVKCKDYINSTIDKVSQGKIEELQVYDLINLSFRDIGYDFFKEMTSQLMNYVESCSNMIDIAIAESELVKFCRKEDILDPEYLYQMGEQLAENTSQRMIFSQRLLGSGYVEIERDASLKKQVKDVFEMKKDCLLKGNKTSIFLMDMAEYDNYFRNMKAKDISKWKKETIAIIDAAGALDIDLMITVKGLAVVKHNEVTEVVFYSDIKLEDDALVCEGYASDVVGNLVWGTIPISLLSAKKIPKKSKFKYKNKNVKIAELYYLICDIDRIIPKNNTPKIEKDGKIEFNGRDYYDFLCE